MDVQQLRDLTVSLFAKLQQRDTQLAEQQSELSRRDEELKRKQLKIEQLTHEMATLKRWHYARRSEQLDAVQLSLLDESIDADLEAIGLEIEALKTPGRRWTGGRRCTPTWPSCAVVTRSVPSPDVINTTEPSVRMRCRILAIS